MAKPEIKEKAKAQKVQKNNNDSRIIKLCKMKYKYNLIALTGPIFSEGMTGATFDKRISRANRKTVRFDCRDYVRYYIEWVKNSNEKYKLVYLAWDSDYSLISEHFGAEISVINVGAPESKFRAKWQFEPFVHDNFLSFIEQDACEKILRIRSDVKLDMNAVNKSFMSLGDTFGKIIVPYIASEGKMQDFYFGGTPNFLVQFCKNIKNGHQDIHGPHYDALLCQTSLRHLRWAHKFKLKYLKYLSRYVGSKMQVALDKGIYVNLEWRGEKFVTLYGHM